MNIQQAEFAIHAARQVRDVGALFILADQCEEMALALGLYSKAAQPWRELESMARNIAIDFYAAENPDG